MAHSSAMTRIQAVFAIVLIVAVVLVGALGWQTFYAPQSTRQILVGASLPLTGTFAALGTQCQWAYQRAVRLVNEGGGIDIDGMGKLMVKLIIYDDQSDPNIVVANVDKLITVDKVDFLLGSVATPLVAPAAGEAEKFQILLVTGGSSSIALRQRGFRHVFIAFESNEQYIRTVFEMLGKLPLDARPKTIAVWAENTGLGTEFGSEAERLAPEYGLVVVVNEIYPPGASDYTDLITKSNTLKPDVVIGIPSTPDAVNLVRQSKQLGFSPNLFCLIRGGHPPFYEALGKDGEYVVTTAPWSPNLDYPGNKELVEDYRASGQDPRKAGALGSWYSVAQVLFDAIRTARSINAEKVTQTLLTETFDTVEGPIKFTETGVRTVDVTIVIFQWRQGEQEAVYPERLATRKLIYPAPTWSQRSA